VNKDMKNGNRGEVSNDRDSGGLMNELPTNASLSLRLTPPSICWTRMEGLVSRQHL